MKRQWQFNHMAYSSASENFKQSFNTYSNISIPPRVQSRSKQKSMDKSKDKFYTGYQYLAQKSSFNNYKAPQSTTLKEIPSYEHKENPMRKDIDIVSQRVRELETRLFEYQQRVETLERTSRHTSKLSTSLEDFMRNHYADIKERERFQQRLETFQQALGHMSTIKADRKDLQSIEVGRYYGLTQRINQLQRQNKRVDTEIQEVNQNFQKFLSKIETNFALMGEKYEDFIESNIIKTIDHVNKLTQHYHSQIEQLSKNQSIMNDKMQTIQKAAINELSRYQKKMNFSTEMIGISLPGLKLVQSIIIKDERRPKQELIQLKQHAKQQHRGKPHCTESSSISTSFSDTLLNSMYDSLDNPGSNTSMQLSFQKAVYKLDSNFNLLDQNDHYIVNESGEHIKLTERHVSLLREHGMIL